MKTLIGAVLLLVLLGTPAAAWDLIPLEKLIADSDVVVIGKLAHILRDPPGPAAVDRGYLDAYEVLKGHVADGRGVVLQFPGQRGQQQPDGTFRSSLTAADLRFEQGMEVCWLLKKVPGTDAYEATHPACAQPYPFYDSIRRTAAEVTRSGGNWQKAMATRMAAIAAKR